MNSVPPCGRYFFSAKSSTPMISEAKNTPVTRPSPPTATHDQEASPEILQRILRIEAEELGTEAAAERRHAAAERERDGEQPRRC